MFWFWPGLWPLYQYTTGRMSPSCNLLSCRHMSSGRLVTMAWLAYILHCPCVLSFPRAPSVAKCCQQLGIQKSWSRRSRSSSTTITQQYTLKSCGLKNLDHMFHTQLSILACSLSQLVTVYTRSHELCSSFGPGGLQAPPMVTLATIAGLC